VTGHGTPGPGRWFQPDQADPEAAVRLFLFPYAGGPAQIYREWFGLFPGDIAAQGVQLPGRLDRRTEPPYTDLEPLLEAMGEAFAAELDDRPFAVFGHSMGALLAYRLTVLLEHRYGLSPVLLGAAGWAPEGFAMPTLDQINRPQEEVVAWIASLGSLPPAIYQDPQMLAITFPPTVSDLLICANYVDDGAAISCPVVTYTGKSDPLMTRESAASWAGRCGGYLGNCEYPGGHFFIYDEHLAIAADLTRHLRHRVPASATPT
jgi:surfactin synthase thioesterase subunit